MTTPAIELIENEDGTWTVKIFSVTYTGTERECKNIAGIEIKDEGHEAIDLDALFRGKRTNEQSQPVAFLMPKHHEVDSRRREFFERPLPGCALHYPQSLPAARKGRGRGNHQGRR